MLDSLDSSERSETSSDGTDHVVLLDERGRPSGTMAKTSVHHRATPLHLAFSCHVVRSDGRVLITRRSLAKRTWPGVWSNACCGHPRLGETLRQAVHRHVAAELGFRVGRIGVAIGDFAYRAEMADGVVEHELCPVVVAEVAGPMRLDPAEADGAEWVEWTALRERARDTPNTLSPWVVAQLARLPASPVDVLRILDDSGRGDAGLLDAPILLTGPPRGDRSATVRLENVVAPVDAVLRAFLDERQRELVALDASAADLGRAVSQLVLGGGKRLRPAFVHWGWRAAQQTLADSTDAPAIGGIARSARPVDVLGAAMELLHTFALLHDDVMDRAVTRRGSPTAHAAFAAAHRDGAARGDPELFGTSAATLAGDLAFVWADQLLDRIEVHERHLRPVREVFGRLRIEVIAGQHLDLVAGCASLDGDGWAGEALATTVALLKSARYTVTRPLELGAALAGQLDRRSPVAHALRTYGDAIGLAFQMRDDVLDIFGDPAATGKAALADLREGKRTVLLERALRLAAPADAELLRACVGRSDLSDADASRCREVLACSGALASVEALIAAQHRSAIDALAGIDDGEVRAALAELANLAVNREA